MKNIQRPIALILLISLLCVPIAVEDACANDDEESAPITWKDTETQQVLFTSEDIVAFDWEKQIFLLELDATLDFLAWIPPHRHLSRKLVVEDAEGPIYEAQWVSWASSMTYEGPIYETLSPNPYFKIVDGYPGLESLHSTPPIQFHSRLKAGLEALGVLQEIDITNINEEIAIQTTVPEEPIWRECGDGLKIRLQLFDNTVQLGRAGRLHLFFATDDEAVQAYEDANLEIRLTGDQTRITREVLVEPIPVESIREGIHVCRFDPWMSRVNVDMELPEMPMTMSISVVIRVRMKDNEGVTSEHRVDFGEMQVPVRNASSNE